MVSEALLATLLTGMIALFGFILSIQQRLTKVETLLKLVLKWVDPRGKEDYNGKEEKVG